MRCESARQKFAERPARRFPVARYTHDDELRRKLLEHLTTDPTWRRGLLRLGRDRDGVELLNSMSHGGRHCTSLGANSRRIRSVLDVTPVPDASVASDQRRANSKVRV